MTVPIQRKQFAFIRVHPWFLWMALVLPWSGAAAQESIIHLKNGGKVEARITEFRDDVLSFRSDASTVSAQMPYSQIEYVEMRPPDDFTRAMQFFEFGRFEEAAPIFEQVAANRTRATGYPAPGNFAILARRRLLDCYRRLADGEAVSRHLGQFEMEMLPPGEREIPPVFEAWAAAGSKDWSRVLAIVEAASEAERFSNASEQGIEMAYLRGLALQASGEPGEALVSFATAYSLNAATDPRISRAALVESARILERDGDRFAEFQAQVHLYASLFGKGGLWSEAGESARAILGEEVEIGEAALGQSGRTTVDGDFLSETFGLRATEQVTADHMKKVGLNRKVEGAKKKTRE